jgi:hypothetical protein
MSLDAIAAWMLVVLVGEATLEGAALRVLVRRTAAMRRSRAVKSRVVVAQLAAGRKERP